MELNIKKIGNKFAVCFVNDFGRDQVIEVAIGIALYSKRAEFSRKSDAVRYLDLAISEVSRVLKLRAADDQFKFLTPVWPAVSMAAQK